MTPKKGFIVYTGTAFEQDSGQAMKNDIVRALIELITNSDDAYARAKKSGTIDIVLRRSTNSQEPVTITVRDRATGLDPEGMEESFVVLGGDKSGFAEGEEVRGLFSRGSKDTAWFGLTVFESIKNGIYTKLELNSKGHWEIESSDATVDNYKELDLPEGTNGLSATIHIQRQDTRIPDMRDLVQRLTSHVQLRQVTITQNVTISEFKDGKLIQAPKAVWTPPKSTEILNEMIDIHGYDCQAHLIINRLVERSEGPVTEYSSHGIEVRGGRAAYMNTMFGQVASGVALISGTLSCPKIDELIRSFGKAKAADAKNPMRLVSRSRDGLEETHPFMQAVTLAVLEKLKPILAELEPKSPEIGGPQLRKDLDTFAKLLAEEMKADLDEDNDGGVGTKTPTLSDPIVVIPPVAKARLGSKVTLTVLVHEDSPAVRGLQHFLSSNHCTVLGSFTELKQHASFAKTLVCQLRLQTQILGSVTVLISAAEKAADKASAEILVHDDPDNESEPDVLEWKNSIMSLTVGKTRSVLLRAPLSLAPTGELEAVITIDSTNIQLEGREVTLKLTNKGWLEARVRLSSAAHSTDAGSITARAGGQEAKGSIKTILPNAMEGLNIEPKIVDEFAGPSRGEMVEDDTCTKLRLYGKHRVLASRLGKPQKDGTWERESELDTRVVIAEIMATVAADFVLMKKVKNDPNKFQDIDRIVFERTKIVDRYIRIMFEALRETS